MSADISCVIPARDRLWSLPKAVKSCRSANLRIEIIVIDDGSTDGTPEWLREQTDLIIVNGEGWGKPWGIARALPLATGKYLRYLDSDDWLSPDANELQFETAELERADVVVGGVDIYEDETFIESVECSPTDDFIAQQLGEGSGSHYSAFLFRRDFVDCIPHRTLFPASNFASRDDRCFMLEVALKQPRIAVTNGATLCHRHHKKPRMQFHGGLSSVGTNIQHLFIYRQILHLLDSSGELTLRRRRAANQVLWPLAHRIGYSHLDEACDLAAWVYRLDPNFHPPERGALGYMYRHLGFGKTETILRMRRRLLALVQK